MPQSFIRRLQVSATLAIIGGIVLPFLETLRRIHQIFDINFFFSWFDDYIIGAFLLISGIQLLRRGEQRQPLLCAAWGFASGMGLYSFMNQLQHISADDPSQLPSSIVVITKGLMLLIAVIGMSLTIPSRPKF